MRKKQTGSHSYQWVDDTPIKSWWGENWSSLLVCALFIGVLIGGGLIIRHIWNLPEKPTFALRKADWICTQEHVESHPNIGVVIGKGIFMNVPNVSSECVNYHRIGH